MRVDFYGVSLPATPESSAARYDMYNSPVLEPESLVQADCAIIGSMYAGN